MPGFNPIGASSWADNLDAFDALEVQTPISPEGGAAATGNGAAFYKRAQRTAARQLKKYCTGIVTLERDTRTETEDPLVPYTVVTTSKTRNAYSGDYSDETISKSNGLILASDRRVILDATDIKNFIRNVDRIKIGTQYHSIVRVKPVPSDGVVSVYICQCRSAN